MKHVGRMKNNGAKVAIVYRTLPGDPHSCLVVATNGLADSFHDSFMSVLESDMGQQTNELADILSARRFPDGSIMLAYLHNNGHLVKTKTNAVNVTPDTRTAISLDNLNEMIAEQKGVTIDQLAVTDGSQNQPIAKKSAPEPVKEETKPAVSTTEFELTPTEMRSRADALFKQAQALRKKADEMDPPKTKAKKQKEQAITE